jgi:hypothetical protein
MSGHCALMAATHYVDVNSTNPVIPFATWATAANVLQMAVDVAAAGDEVVVTNGVYATGARGINGSEANRVGVGKALTVRSVNGPQFTVIQGQPPIPPTNNSSGAIRCAYLVTGASLSGFTLTNGMVSSAGGGVFCDSPSAAGLVVAR